MSRVQNMRYKYTSPHITQLFMTIVGITHLRTQRVRRWRIASNDVIMKSRGFKFHQNYDPSKFDYTSRTYNLSDKFLSGISEILDVNIILKFLFTGMRLLIPTR